MPRHKTGFGTIVKVTTTTPAVALELEEIDVTPPGLVGNEKIEQSSNRNTKYKSFEPGDLVEITDLEFEAYYDTDQWDAIKSILQVPGAIEITFKNGTVIDDTYGWLVSAEPTGQTVGNRPTMRVVVSFQGEDAAGAATQTVTPGA